MKDFDGKVAVVTGTANRRGIGYAIARRLANLGCRLVLADVDSEGISARASEFQEAGFESLAVVTDMGDPSSVQQLADTADRTYGPTHILVLNHVAPTGGRGHSILSPDTTAWDLHARVNLLGVVYGIKAFAPRMIASGQHCHLLATTSGAGTTGVMYGNGPYACTKAGITTAMECLYGELRDARADVVPSLIFPGVTDTFSVPGMGQMVVDSLADFGATTTLSAPEEVADFTVDAIERDLFWAYPDLLTDQRLADGRHADSIAWENGMYQRRATALIERRTPDSYLWGPPSSYLEQSPS